MKYGQQKISEKYNHSCLTGQRNQAFNYFAKSVIRVYFFTLILPQRISLVVWLINIK